MNKIQKIAKQPFFWLFLFSILLGIIPLILYFTVFHSGLSTNHSTWSEFGDFIGGILGPVTSTLAFIGMFYTLKITKEQFSDQKEETCFFELIALHTLTKLIQLNLMILTVV